MEFESLLEALKTTFNFQDSKRYLGELSEKGVWTTDAMAKWIAKEAERIYIEREQSYGEETLRELEKYFFLQSIDHQWKEHLLALDHLKEGIHLRGYAQKDPLVEYRKEGFDLFKLLDQSIRQSALSRLYSARIMSQAEREEMRKREEEATLKKLENAEMSFPSLDGDSNPTPQAVLPVHGSGASLPPNGAATSGAAPAAAPANPALQAAMSFMKNTSKKKFGR